MKKGYLILVSLILSFGLLVNTGSSILAIGEYPQPIINSSETSEEKIDLSKYVTKDELKKYIPFYGLSISKIREDCYLSRGCFIDNNCYPEGFRINYTFCYFNDSITSRSISVKRSYFLNQSSVGEECNYDYQCLSNFCFNKTCTEDLENIIFILLDRIEILENKVGLLEKETIEDPSNEIIVEEETETSKGINQNKIFIGHFLLKGLFTK